VFHINFNLEGLGDLFGGLSPPKPPSRRSGGNYDSGAQLLWSTEKSQKYLKYFLDKMPLLPKDPRFEHGSPSLFLASGVT